MQGDALDALIGPLSVQWNQSTPINNELDQRRDGTLLLKDVKTIAQYQPNQNIHGCSLCRGQHWSD